MIRSALIMLFSSLLLTAWGQLNLTNQKEQALDSLFSDWDSNQKPGGVIAIISENHVIYKKHFGLQEVKKKTPFSSQTPINLASVAKQFTGMCIALLEQQGEISLEDDIRKFFPDIQYSSTIQIKHLLSHTSGIRELTDIAILSGRVNLKGELPYKYLNKDYLLEILSKERDLNFEPGSEMSYTNTNYVLLADIVEQVGGMSFENFADSAIFRPLKMDQSFFGDFSSSSEIDGYAYNGEKFRKTNASGGLIGEDNLVSTIDDLILWDRNFYNNILGNKKGDLIEKVTSSSTLNNGDPTN